MFKGVKKHFGKKKVEKIQREKNEESNSKQPDTRKGKISGDNDSHGSNSFDENKKKVEKIEKESNAESSKKPPTIPDKEKGQMTGDGDSHESSVEENGHKKGQKEPSPDLAKQMERVRVEDDDHLGTSRTKEEQISGPRMEWAEYYSKHSNSGDPDWKENMSREIIEDFFRY